MPWLGWKASLQRRPWASGEKSEQQDPSIHPLAKKANSLLVSLGGHLSLLSTGETHLEYWVQVGAPGCKTGMDFCQKIQQGAMGMIKGLEHLTYEDKLRKLRPREDKAGDLKMLNI